MKLLDLEPRWLSPTLFVFRCPACSNGYISITSKPLGLKEQFDLFRRHVGDDFSCVHPCKPDAWWSFSGSDFETITVTPSLDVLNHWHHNITNGEIV